MSAALAVLPASAPLTDLPPGADPCLALTPAVVDQLRTSGALTPLVPDEIPTGILITAGRSVTACPPTADPDPATVLRHVCPLLTAEGVRTLADRFGATPAVRADLGPERIATARNALRCDAPAATASAATTAEPGTESSSAVDRADQEVRREQERAVISSTAAVVALIGVLLLMVALRPWSRRRGGGSAAARCPAPEATRSAQQSPDDRQRSTPVGDSDVRDRPDSYDELLAGLRREVTRLQRADEVARQRPTKPDGSDER